LIEKVKTKPYFITLIPMFFVLHGFVFYFGFIPIKDALLLALIYCIGSLLLFLFLRFFYKAQQQKAAIVSAYLLSAYFFFGAYQDFLKKYAPFLSRYSILLTLILAGFLIIIWRIKKVESVKKLVFFLNLVFITYIFIDLIQVTFNYTHPHVNKFTVPYSKDFKYSKILENKKPDIYFLIFDEYASSASLKNNYSYNNGIDSILEQRGFKVQTKSHSNYFFTPVSIASILNMSFISGLRDSSILTAKDMNSCFGLIKYNEVCRFLSSQGYEIINCSHFNLQNSPVPIDDPILPVKTGLITDNTLYSKVTRDVIGDIGWNPLAKYLPWAKINVDHGNLQFLKMIKDQSSKTKEHPIFLFGPLFMPTIIDRVQRLKSRMIILILYRITCNIFRM